MTLFYQILYIFTEVFHGAITLAFLYSILLIPFKQKTPFNYMYLALIVFSQAVYNGCPVSEFTIFFASRIGKEFSNEFWFGAFEGYETPARIITLFLSTFLFYLSYITWDKENQKINLNIQKLFKKHDFNIPGDKELA